MITPIQSHQWNPIPVGLGLPRSVPSWRKETTPARDAGPDVSADLSPLAVRLSEEGLDFSSSAVEKVTLGMDFNLEFSSSSVERLSASGYYLEESETMHLAWQVRYQREEIVDGRAELRTYEANLRASVTQVSRTTVSSYVQKEDIMSLVRRLMEDIHKIAADDSKALGGVVLDYSDFREIFAIDNGRLAHDLMALIELTIMLARLRQMLEGDSDAEDVILAPQREETKGTVVTQSSMRVESFQLEIRDVTAELSTASAGNTSVSSTAQESAISDQAITD
jgi:hypothetical protein